MISTSGQQTPIRPSLHRPHFPGKVWFVFQDLRFSLWELLIIGGWEDLSYVIELSGFTVKVRLYASIIFH